MNDIPQHYIPRPGLMQLLDSQLGKKALLFCAPPGYGKTATVSLWLSHQWCEKRSITLDEHDNNPAGFCRRFCSMLMDLDPGNPRLAEFVNHRGFDGAPLEFTAHAIGAMQSDVRGILVLDNLHVITNRSVVRFLPVALGRLPQGVQLIMISRNAPPRSLGTLILKNTVAVIGAEDLLMNSADIQAAFKRAGHPITPQLAEQVCQYTEGWPLGVNAMLLSGSTHLGSTRLHAYLERFFRDDVWAFQDADTQAFMLETAVEHELTPALCAALTGREDCEAILTRLHDRNVFITQLENGAYSFRRLFRDFLTQMFQRQPPAFRQGQFVRAGDWYAEQKKYVEAINCYISAEHGPGIQASLFGLAVQSSLMHLDIGTTLPLLKHPLVVAELSRCPELFSFQAWASFLSGDADAMEATIPHPYPIGPSMTPIQQAAASYVYCLDYRNSLKLLVKSLKTSPDIQTQPGTITQNMPLFHRSIRDFSEFAGEHMLADVADLRRVMGDFFGPEQGVLEACLTAGLYYEQGELGRAASYALSAVAQIEPHFAPETKLCALTMQAHVQVALGEYDHAQALLERAKALVLQDNAPFLSRNLEAYIFHLRIRHGAPEAASQWLKHYAVRPLAPITFFDLYAFFTTARAHIALGDSDSAIIILNKVLALCQRYRRPLDVIEIHILLAIAFQRKTRRCQQEALDHLEQAVLAAAPYSYTQLFVNEGAEISGLLYRLQSRTARRDYEGPIPASFAKMLYLQTVDRARQPRAAAAADSAPSKFTRQQLRVMRLLCQGYSYRRIAETMGIKFSTVRSHMQLIYKKLDVPNETEAVLKIRELGILEDEGTPVRR